MATPATADSAPHGVHKGRQNNAKPRSKSAKKSTTQSGKKVTAHWTEQDEKTLINYLATDGKAAAADGANYRKSVWEGAARKFAVLPCKGAPKTWQVCKNKWGRLKKAYWAIYDLKYNGSGLTYSEEKGAGITEDMEEIWAGYVKAHPDASPFKTKGFVHYTSMQPLMPTKAKGSNVFRPGQAEEDASHTQDQDAAEDRADEDEDENGEEDEDVLDDDEDENEDEEDEEEIVVPTTPAPSQKRKSALPQSTSTKKIKMSQGAQALQAVGEKLDDFNTILRSLVALESQEPASSGPITPTTPQHKQMAIRRAQKLESHLDDNRLVSLINIFQKDGSAADAYLVLERDGLRRAWVDDQLDSN